MHQVVEANLNQIRALCLKHSVQSLHAFGSGLRDDFDADRSDLDFVVEFLPLPPGQRADAYFGLLEDLRKLLGRDVDLVVGSAIRNPYFRRSVNESRVPLYAAA